MSRILSLSRYIIQIFLLHASIVKPLGESGKLKLTTDMTELEVAISSILTTGHPQGSRMNSNAGIGGGVSLTGQNDKSYSGTHSIGNNTKSRTALRLDQIGDEYLALRSFRTILFSDIASLRNPVETVHLPPLVVLHHIIVLSSNPSQSHFQKKNQGEAIQAVGLKLPHEMNGWTEVEYVAWAMKHQDQEERLALVEKAIEGQVGGLKSAEADAEAVEAAGVKAEGGDGREWYVSLIREVVEHARQSEGTPLAQV